MLEKHLKTFRELEGLQVAAFERMKNQLLEGLSELLTRQQAVTQAIAEEKAQLRPYLDQWEALTAGERERLRAGKPGEILEALETVAQAIQARHQDWFGADAAPASADAGDAGSAGQADLDQLINLYRSQQ